MNRLSKTLALMLFIMTAFFLFSVTSLGADVVTVECDTDSEHCDSITLNVRLDKENKTATVLKIEDCYYYAYIPQTITYNSTKYTITGIEGTNNDIDRIEIPETVTYIAPNSVGYYEEYDGDYYYDEETDEWYYESIATLYPIEGFAIYSYKNTAAQNYATENGFRFVTLYRLTAENVSLKKTSFTYTGDEICPEVIITVDGKTFDSDDFWIEYGNNYNAGTAYVEVTPDEYSEFRDIKTIKKEFTIKKVKASAITFPKVAARYYTGEEIEPYDYDLKYNGEYLWEGEDYTVKFSDNVKPGKGKITFKLKGNYTGTKTIEFDIKVGNIEYFDGNTYGGTYMYLDWGWVKADGYRLYQYNTKTKKYELLKKTKNTWYEIYKEKGFPQLTTYKFAVKAYVNTDKGAVYGKTSYVTVNTGLTPISFYLKPTTKNIKLVWTANPEADGYKIYRCKEGSYDYSRVKIVKDGKTTSWTDKNANNKKEYSYYVVAYKKIDGKTLESNSYNTVYSDSPESRMNGASLNPHRSFNIYDTQGKTTTHYRTVTLSDNDIKIIKKFAKDNFKKGMTEAEKVMVTLEWINKNVKYASASSDWNSISGLSYVNAIFNKKMGQCAQYNGALASVMAYLGYDVSMVKGYRGSTTGYKTQHFWTEVKIQGKTYVMETGNYGRNGNWSYYCLTYSECGGYIKNGKDL